MPMRQERFRADRRKKLRTAVVTGDLLGYGSLVRKNGPQLPKLRAGCDYG